ncbi:hypothetical protein DL766_004688 [Monosporascus sp. MC13-8B]|uniref:Uncharacterized protein n=1 Tax=Monosporascus cannonballus TaxID=155416 RepID=A0ABY0H323_9PEZI|nr:hypothetical protein DL762_006222 [Monosporascus cannonballus]RYO99247.1 hypothetical protein DL763_001611 [Monosporascus cannonballus]RYP30861.1 hypothetical protein DL766_004688 [Monosporascus sp. MC13-8B]
MPRRKRVPPQDTQDNGSRTGLDRLRQDGRKRARSTEQGHGQAGRISEVSSDSGFERVTKRKRSDTESQAPSVRSGSCFCRALQATASQGCNRRRYLEDQASMGVHTIAPTSPAGVEAAAHLPPTKGHAERGGRCNSCGLSPQVLLSVTKKALASDDSLLDNLPEGGETELLLSQSALLVLRSCSSIIQSHLISRLTDGPGRNDSKNLAKPSSSRLATSGLI